MRTSAAAVLALLAAAVVAVPVFVPGDGLRWRPASDGLAVTRVVDDRDLGIGPGARIVSINAAPWRDAAYLARPFTPPAWGDRAQYVIHEAGFAKNRIVSLRPLSFGRAVRGYARPAALLLLLAVLAAWGVRTNRDAAAVLLAGAGVAAYVAGNLSPLTLELFGLRHLEVAVSCWAGAGALVLGGGVHRGPPAAVWAAGGFAVVTGLWLASESRWVWWRAATAFAALEVVAGVAARLVFYGQQHHQEHRENPEQHGHAH